MPLPHSIGFFLGGLMEDHKHGEMDITEQEKVYSGFIKFGVYVGLFTLFVLIFLALFNS